MQEATRERMMKTKIVQTSQLGSHFPLSPQEEIYWVHCSLVMQLPPQKSSTKLVNPSLASLTAAVTSFSSSSLLLPPEVEPTRHTTKTDNNARDTITIMVPM